jgi:hypothetical protein
MRKWKFVGCNRKFLKTENNTTITSWGKKWIYKRKGKEIISWDKERRQKPIQNLSSNKKKAKNKPT